MPPKDGKTRRRLRSTHALHGGGGSCQHLWLDGHRQYLLAEGMLLGTGGCCLSRGGGCADRRLGRGVNAPPGSEPQALSAAGLLMLPCCFLCLSSTAFPGCVNKEGLCNHTALTR